MQEWTAAGVFLAWWEQGLLADDALQGLDGEWLAMDGARTTAPLGGQTGGRKPSDRGKLGTQRRLRTDGGGVPVGLAVEGANRHAFKMARETIASMPVERPDPTADHPQGRCLAKGEDDDEVRHRLAECGFTARLRARGEEAKALKPEAGFKARRWVVDRTHSWMNRFRRVWIRWDKTVRTYLACLHLACASITFRQSGLLG